MKVHREAYRVIHTLFYSENELRSSIFGWGIEFLYLISIIEILAIFIGILAGLALPRTKVMKVILAGSTALGILVVLKVQLFGMSSAGQFLYACAGEIFAVAAGLALLTACKPDAET